MTWGYFSVSARRSWRQPVSRDPGAEAVLDGLVGEGHVHQRVEPLGVGGHPQRRGEGRRALVAARESVELGVEEGAQDLPHPVGAEVDAEEPRARLHPAVVADRRGLDELVGLAAGVGGLDGGERVGLAAPLAEPDRPPGALHPVPAVVPVHGEEAARHRADRDARQPLDLGEEGGKLRPSGPRPDVAAVGDEVEDDRHAPLRQRAGGGGDVALVAVDAAGAGETQHVGGAARLPEPGGEARHRGPVGEVPPGDGLVDARQVHQDDAARADGGVADLGVAHLPLRQADVGAVGHEGGMRAAREEVVHGGRARQERRVALLPVAEAPSVEDAQDDGSAHGGLRSASPPIGTAGPPEATAPMLPSVALQGRSRPSPCRGAPARRLRAEARLLPLGRAGGPRGPRSPPPGGTRAPGPP